MCAHSRWALSCESTQEDVKREELASFSGQEQEFDMEFIASANAARRIPGRRVRQPLDWRVVQGRIVDEAILTPVRSLRAMPCLAT